MVDNIYKQIRNGYSYSVNIEEIQKYQQISPENKLIWLEDANSFLAKALTGRRRLIWDAFRSRPNK